MINVFSGYSDNVVTLLRGAVVNVIGPDFLEYHNTCGLCHSIDVWLSASEGGDYYRVLVRCRVRNLFDVLYKQWPEFSGCLIYPVPCPDGGCPEKAFDYNEGSMYTGSYGESRLRLADFVVEQCDLELNRRSTQC